MDIHIYINQFGNFISDLTYYLATRDLSKVDIPARHAMSRECKWQEQWRRQW